MGAEGPRDRMSEKWKKDFPADVSPWFLQVPTDLLALGSPQFETI
jgi:hypothetical protein